jgi:hypothetical protein
VREGDPQKDQKDDKEDHICDRGKIQQHRVSFHFVSFVKYYRTVTQLLLLGNCYLLATPC